MGIRQAQRILIIEEDRVEAGIIAFHLRRAGYKPLLVSSSEEAADAVAWGTPDAVVAELGGTGINGLNFAASLVGNKLVFVLISDRPLTADEQLKALRLRVHHLVQKPVDPGLLVERLGRTTPHELGPPEGTPEDEIPGSLTHHSVVALVRMVARHQTDCRLAITSGDTSGWLIVRQGQVIDAALGAEDGRNAAVEMLLLEQGQFVLNPLAAGAPELLRHDAVNTDLATLITEAMNRSRPAGKDQRRPSQRRAGPPGIAGMPAAASRPLPERHRSTWRQSALSDTVQRPLAPPVTLPDAAQPRGGFKNVSADTLRSPSPISAPAARPHLPAPAQRPRSAASNARPAPQPSEGANSPPGSAQTPREHRPSVDFRAPTVSKARRRRHRHQTNTKPRVRAGAAAPAQRDGDRSGPAVSDTQRPGSASYVRQPTGPGPGTARGNKPTTQPQERRGGGAAVHLDAAPRRAQPTTRPGAAAFGQEPSAESRRVLPDAPRARFDPAPLDRPPTGIALPAHPSEDGAPVVMPTSTGETPPAGGAPDDDDGGNRNHADTPHRPDAPRSGTSELRADARAFEEHSGEPHARREAEPDDVPSEQRPSGRLSARPDLEPRRESASQQPDGSAPSSRPQQGAWPQEHHGGDVDSALAKVRGRLMPRTFFSDGERPLRRLTTNPALKAATDTPEPTDLHVDAPQERETSSSTLHQARSGAELEASTTGPLHNAQDPRGAEPRRADLPSTWRHGDIDPAVATSHGRSDPKGSTTAPLHRAHEPQVSERRRADLPSTWTHGEIDPTVPTSRDRVSWKHEVPSARYPEPSASEREPSTEPGIALTGLTAAPPSTSRPPVNLRPVISVLMIALVAAIGFVIVQFATKRTGTAPRPGGAQSVAATVASFEERLGEATLALEQNKVTEAERLFGALAREKTARSDALSGWAKSLFLLERWEDAEGAFESLTQLTPNDPKVYWHLAHIYLANDKKAASDAEVVRLKQRWPESAEAKDLQAGLGNR